MDVILSYIKHIFNLPMSFFATMRTGEIVSRFNASNSIIYALTNTILSIFLDVSTILIIQLVLFSQTVNLFFIIFLALPINALLFFYFIMPFGQINQKIL
ncbi:ABC transporter transmembrane domain-containing protein [Streptococcus thoraltensis]